MKKNWMQIDVAAMTDMDRSYISRIENGKARLTIKKFYQLVHGLEITSSDLLDI